MLYLYAVEGLDMHEIAAIWNVGRSAVSKRFGVLGSAEAFQACGQQRRVATEAVIAACRKNSPWGRKSKEDSEEQHDRAV